MKKVFVFLIVLFFISFRGWAGEEYAVTRIPGRLLQNADAVLRFGEQRFEIINTKRALYTHHYVITILNANGDRWAGFYEYYDKYQRIKSVEAYLYDANGRQLKKINTRGLEDRSGVSDGSLMDDNRVKTHNFYYRSYPYTIEYVAEFEYRSTLFFPRWMPQGGEGLAVEHSSISIVCPPEYEFRYKAFNYGKEPVTVQEKKNKVSTWSINNLAAIQNEPYSPFWHELTTAVIFGPTSFQIDDYRGSMGSWIDFGKFVYTLNEKRDQLPVPVKNTVHQLTDTITDTRQRIATLYEYMQKNTRYVSIQLGIGGWQPFDAAFVASKAYGDCKALTNYMYSLLKEAGIASCYTLIRAGAYSGYITDDFPSQQFNHAILCVPLNEDTMWLECTSQTLKAGYLSDFTSDRYALMIDKDGGHLVRTPKYGLNENKQVRHISAVLQEDATLHINTDTRYTGLQQDDIHMLIHQLSHDKVNEYLRGELDFATYDINGFEYKENRNAPLPAIDEHLDITVSNYATITGKRLFIIPNIMTRSGKKPGRDSTRKYDILLRDEYQATDSVEIDLPPGYEAESIPPDVAITSPFGKYFSSIQLTGNKLVYYRNMEQYSGRFAANEYNDLARYYEDIYKADRNRVVLIKKETQRPRAF